MAFTGKLIGAIIGSVVGPFGTLFGGLIGHFFDRAAEERTAERIFGGMPGPADAVSEAQVGFLSCLIGLSLSVADAGGRIDASRLAALKGFFRANLPYTVDDQDVVERLVDGMYESRGRLDVEGMCAYYRGVSTPGGRLLLLRLLFQIARSDGEGVSAAEEDAIRRIAALLGLDQAAFRRVGAEFVRQPSRAYAILGVSPEAANQEITRSYRKLIMENHPDRVSGLGPEFTRIAEERFKTIQEAYEEIRRERSF
jgi:DnaJ like chaperone protein